MSFFSNNDPDDNRPDFFDGEDLPETKKERRNRYRTDDPRFWEEEDETGQWDHLRPLLRWRIWFFAALAVVLFLGSSFVYIRYFRPYAVGGVQYGYIENIEEQGYLFKTYEGTLLPYRNLMDTTRAYTHDFVFTAATDKVAAELLRASKQHQPVRVEYVRYAATVPWRGDSRIIVTAVTDTDPRQLAPR